MQSIIVMLGNLTPWSHMVIKDYQISGLNTQNQAFVL